MQVRLPIDDVLGEIRDLLQSKRNLVIEAPPGAGKTTRVPPAILEILEGQVLVLQPRRLPARLAARRVAQEQNEEAGGSVGYQVRFERKGSKHTRLWYLTEGMLTRRLAADPRLTGVGAVILDEFHERHLEGDLALALLNRLQRTERPDLRIVVMSATLDAGPVAEFLGGCPKVRSEGRLFPLEIRYTPESPDPLPEQVAGALRVLIRDRLEGDILVFLPGAAEIRQARAACRSDAARAGIEILPLHGDLAPPDQDRAVKPGQRPKLILSTNVAESSVTVEGVSAVIDSGLARVASDSPWTGLPSLRVARISRASADQRAGRAGRVRAGRAVRLYPETVYARFAAQDPPEIVRRELTQMCLDLLAQGLRGPQDLDWLDAPPDEAVAAANSLLSQLSAVDASGRLTDEGRRMSRLPLHPRLSRLVTEARRRGVTDAGCATAALLSAGERLPREAAGHRGASDLLVLLDTPPSPRVRRLTDQIRRGVGPGGTEQNSSDEALLLSVLVAFPDRVACRRRGDDLLLAAGGSARLSHNSVVRSHDLLVAVDIEDRREHGLPIVRLASMVRPEWLFDLYPDQITEYSAVEWIREAERVEMTSALLFGEIPIEENRGGTPDPAEAAELLAARAIDAGLGRFTELEALESFRRRVAFAAEHARVPAIGDAVIGRVLRDLCFGLRSFRDLEAIAKPGFLAAVRATLTPDQHRLLDEVAPERIHLPSGRRSKVNYEPGKPPWTASRLQDFFGLTETPAVARGAVPLVLHLLAPNMRPVQTTTDLAGFWQRLYPRVRSELRRRYPKHAWPENPL